MRSVLAAGILALTLVLASALTGRAEAQTPSFTGEVPPTGGIGLLVTSGPAAAGTLVADLQASGCEAGVVAILRQSTWNIYIPGAPAQVNAQFPAELPQMTPFFTRCAGDMPAGPAPTPGSSGDWPPGPPGPAGNR
jgi:hypothetical protein